MPMRIIPAHNSARRFTRLPKYTPMRHPMRENTNDTIPMTRIGKEMLFQVVMPVQAKEIPTAKASILVATAKVKTTSSRVGLK